jgi:hypothetical protein
MEQFIKLKEFMGNFLVRSVKQNINTPTNSWFIGKHVKGNRKMKV